MKRSLLMTPVQWTSDAPGIGLGLCANFYFEPILSSYIADPRTESTARRVGLLISSSENSNSLKFVSSIMQSPSPIPMAVPDSDRLPLDTIVASS